MRKLLTISLIAISLSTLGCKGGSPFIEGKIDDLAGKKLYLCEYGWTRAEIVDSTKVKKDGTFLFTKGEKQKGEYCLKEKKDAPYNVARFFVDNDIVNVTGSFENRQDMKIEGTISDSLYSDFRRNSGASDFNKTREFAIKYKDFVAAPYVLARHYKYKATLEQIDSLLNLMPEDIQATLYAKRAHFVGKAKKDSQIGSHFTEIVENDTEGNIRSLSTTVANNEYTLLTFWASWCGDCRGNIPYIKNLYDKYYDKGLGIYSVSMDYTEEEWKGYIERNDIKWINVSDIKGWDCVPADKYYVQSITSTFIIDKNGIIVDKLLKKEKLEDKIDELFTKEIK
ncbi:MAG: AhpC/TSA family protein [Bacteroidetes bacterium]|nr:AhpC/TSA family protein [Bacteroidota bacterium]